MSWNILPKGNLQYFLQKLKDKLATVALTGSYNDLSNKPTIPTVNNKTIKVQVNTTDFTNNTFTLNQSSDKTIDIPVTKSTVGLNNVPNVTTNNQTPTFSQASSRANIASGEKLSVIFGKIMKWFADLKDLAFIAKDGDSSTKYLRGDGQWVAFPTIPTKTSDITNDSGFVTSTDITNAINALDVTGSSSVAASKTVQKWSETNGKVSLTFQDISITKEQISNFPTIPTVNDATLTIQKNGTTVKTFTANASSNVTCNITVPTKTSDITNDSGYITTDEEVKQTPLPFNTGSSVQWYRLALGRTRDNNEEINPIYKTSNLVFSDSNEGGTSTTPGKSSLRIGNTTNSGSAGNQYGEIQLAGKNNRVVSLTTDDLTATHYQTFQNKDGTIALTSDIPEAVAVKGNAETNYRTGNVNLTPANIGALALSGGGTVTNNFLLKSTSVDASKSNNNVTSTLYTNYHFYDNASHICGSVRPAYYSGGDIALNLLARNWSAPETGDSVQMASGGFTITASKNGNLGVVLDNSHTATSVKNIVFSIGNDKANGTKSSNDGVLRLYGKGAKYAQFYDSGNKLTDNRTYQLPDANGTMALREDLDWKSVSIGYQPADFVEVCPTTCREMIFDFYGLGATGSTQIPCYTSLHLTTGMVTAAEKTYRTGWYQSNGNGGKATLVVKSANNKVYAKFIEFYINTSNVPSGSCTVYYR